MQACPTAALSGGTVADTTAASLGAGLRAALSGGLFPGYSAVTSATLGADSLVLATKAPAANSLAYSVVQVRGWGLEWGFDGDWGSEERNMSAGWLQYVL